MLRSNKSTLLTQHDVICGTDNVFPMVKLSKSISHEHRHKTVLFSRTVTMVKRLISPSIGKIHLLGKNCCVNWSPMAAQLGIFVTFYCA